MKKETSPIHPELQKVARKMPKLTYSNKNLWLLHVLMRLVPRPKVPQDILVQNIFISSENDRTKIRLRIYKQKSLTAPVPVLLWMHGGGYVIGNPEQDDGSCIQYVHELGILVISVDYRFAPKYPFPVGLEDCHTALQWVVTNAQQLGIDTKHIAVGGASAGGGLAASLIQFVHDRQEIQPIFQLLVYPMLDDRTVLRPEIGDNDHIAWNQKSNRFGWESYLGTRCGAENVPKYAVPARCKKLAGLPETWIGVGTLDLFHDEDLAYAQRLRECGVPCEIYTVPGAFHGFDVFDPDLPIVQDFRKSQISALRKCFAL
jgi:acetyl esterase/lipase